MPTSQNRNERYQRGPPQNSSWAGDCDAPNFRTLEMSASHPPNFGTLEMSAPPHKNFEFTPRFTRARGIGNDPPQVYHPESVPLQS